MFRLASVSAAARPAGPAPIMMTVSLEARHSYSDLLPPGCCATNSWTIRSNRTFASFVDSAFKR